MKEQALIDFNKIVRGKNVITPYVRDYRYVGQKYVVELSQGTGMSDEPIFGVTVANLIEKENEHDLSQMFFSLDEANSHIRNLK